MKKLIEEYQCPGCVCGSDTNCGRYEKLNNRGSCTSHVAGTMITGIGRVFLGMPKGFNRLWNDDKLKIEIYKHVKEFKYDCFNIPVWKYKNPKGHIFVRGIMPRISQTFLQIFQSGDINKIDAFEVTDDFLKNID